MVRPNIVIDALRLRTLAMMYICQDGAFRSCNDAVIQEIGEWERLAISRQSKTVEPLETRKSTSVEQAEDKGNTGSGSGAGSLW